MIHKTPDASLATRWAACLLSLTFFGCAADVGSQEATDSAFGSEAEPLVRPLRGFEVLGPEGKPFGKSYGQWSADWWRWSYGAPASKHPVLDTTGQFCDVDQTHPVFFLAGSFGETARRSCTVPHGKPVFFPLLNLAVDNCGVPPADQVSNRELITTDEHFADSVTSIEVDIDGKVLGASKAELAPYLVDVTRFSYFVPSTDSIYEYFGIDFHGRCSPSFSAGYYVMLALARGKHTLHFAGAEGGDFALDVTYALDVK